MKISLRKTKKDSFRVKETDIFIRRLKQKFAIKLPMNCNFAKLVMQLNSKPVVALEKSLNIKKRADSKTAIVSRRKSKSRPTKSDGVEAEMSKIFGSISQTATIVPADRKPERPIRKKKKAKINVETQLYLEQLFGDLDDVTLSKRVDSAKSYSQQTPKPKVLDIKTGTVLTATEDFLTADQLQRDTLPESQQVTVHIQEDWHCKAVIQAPNVNNYTILVKPPTEVRLSSNEPKVPEKPSSLDQTPNRRNLQQQYPSVPCPNVNVAHFLNIPTLVPPVSTLPNDQNSSNLPGTPVLKNLLAKSAQNCAPSVQSSPNIKTVPNKRRNSQTTNPNKKKSNSPPANIPRIIIHQNIQPRPSVLMFGPTREPIVPPMQTGLVPPSKNTLPRLEPVLFSPIIVLTAEQMSNVMCAHLRRFVTWHCNALVYCEGLQLYEHEKLDWQQDLHTFNKYAEERIKMFGAKFYAHLARFDLLHYDLKGLSNCLALKLGYSVTFVFRALRFMTKFSEDRATTRFLGKFHKNVEMIVDSLQRRQARQQEQQQTPNQVQMHQQAPKQIQVHQQAPNQDQMNQQSPNQVQMNQQSPNQVQTHQQSPKQQEISKQEVAKQHFLQQQQLQREQQLRQQMQNKKTMRPQEAHRPSVQSQQIQQQPTSNEVRPRIFTINQIYQLISQISEFHRLSASASNTNTVPSEVASEVPPEVASEVPPEVASEVPSEVSSEVPASSRTSPPPSSVVEETSKEAEAPEQREPDTEATNSCVSSDEDTLSTSTVNEIVIIEIDSPDRPDEGTDVDMIDLTWIDGEDTNLDESLDEIKDFKSFIPKIESNEMKVCKDEPNREIASPADSGLGSPVSESDLKCLCGKEASFVCPCNLSMYCSTDCQRIDWSDHQLRCTSFNNDE